MKTSGGEIVQREVNGALGQKETSEENIIDREGLGQGMKRQVCSGHAGDMNGAAGWRPLTQNESWKRGRRKQMEKRMVTGNLASKRTRKLCVGLSVWYSLSETKLALCSHVADGLQLRSQTVIPADG